MMGDHWASLGLFIEQFPHLDVKQVRKWCAANLLTSKTVDDILYINMESLESMREEFKAMWSKDDNRFTEYSFLDGGEYTQRPLIEHVIKTPRFVNPAQKHKQCNYRKRSKIK